MADPNNDFQIVHTLWTALITVGGLIVAFFTKRLVDQVDKKADQNVVNELKEDIKAILARQDVQHARQDVQHASNSARLDQIIMELGRGGNR